MQRCLRVIFLNLSCCILLLLRLTEAQAVPAMGMGYEPKYPPDFTRFDYVAADAEKGGEITPVSYTHLTLPTSSVMWRSRGWP